jgi:hypothetical protein
LNVAAIAARRSDKAAIDVSGAAENVHPPSCRLPAMPENAADNDRRSRGRVDDSHEFSRNPPLNNERAVQPSVGAGLPSGSRHDHTSYGTGAAAADPVDRSIAAATDAASDFPLIVPPPSSLVRHLPYR